MSAAIEFHIVGDIFVDLFCFLEGDWPELGGDANLAQPVSTMAGGSALNTATHLNSLIRHCLTSSKSSSLPSSQSVVLQSVINQNDQYGKLVLKHVSEQGFLLVNCLQELEEAKEGTPPSTGHCMCIVAKGERSFMTHNGAMSSFRACHIQTQRLLAPVDVHIHVAGYFNIPGLWNGKLKDQIEALRSDRRTKFPNNLTSISLNPQFDPSDQWDGGIDDLFPLLDFAIMNDLEATRIVARGGDGGDTGGAKDGDQPSLDEKIQTWATHLAKLSTSTTYVVTLGKEGAIALKDGKIVASQSAAIVDVIDPTGAGDSFASGFLHGIWSWRHLNDSNIATTTRSWPAEAVKEGLLWGCSVGAACVQIRGASIPAKPKDIQDFNDQARNS